MTQQETPRIKHLVIYPVKSTAGIEVPNATLTEDGLVIGQYKDHQFMIVRAEADESGIYNFITQRDKRNKEDNPQGLSALALVKPRFIDDVLELTWRYESPITVPNDRNHGKELPVRIWDDTCYAVDQGDGLAKWLSDHLGLPVRLVKAEGSFSRMSRQNYVANTNPVRFQDGYPIHWFAIESVDELSQLAGQNIPWQSFRPQIVTEGTQPQFEHKIYSGQIAGIPFIDPKPCDRCPVTLVNQETGEVRKKEPLQSLSKYKRWRNRDGDLKVIFGENMLPLGRGTITIGDELVVSNYRNPQLVYGKNV
mgnify:CR=1 FL=1